MSAMRFVAEYSVDFGILSTESGWDDVVLQAAFRQGLSDQVPTL